MNNKKNVLALIVSGTFVLAALIYFLVPIGGNLPGTYKDFSSKSAEAQTMNAQKQDLSKQLNELRRDVKEKEEELKQTTEASERSQELFNDLLVKQSEGGDWSYHVPSLLIKLEKNADDRNIKIAMDYETFKGDGEFVSSSGKGLQVITVKVDIYGNYHNVKEYIKSIENIDFISVEDLVLNRVDNGDLTGTYNLNIYYMEN